MKPSDLRGLSDDELLLNLTDNEKHLFKLRFQSATDRLETPSEIAKAKKAIARIKTEQRRREIERQAALSSDELKQKLTDLAGQIEGPGKRRVQRELQRVLRAIVEKEVSPATEGK